MQTVKIIIEVTLKRNNGVECVVKDYPLDRPAPPVGAIITVKHNGAHPNGLLNKPSYWRHLDPELDITNTKVSAKFIPL